MTMQPNLIAGAAAGWKSQISEMTQVAESSRSGSAQLWGRPASYDAPHTLTLFSTHSNLEPP